MRGVKGSEIIGVVFFGFLSLGLIGLSYWQTYAGLSGSQSTNGSPELVRLLGAFVGLVVAAQTGRTAWVRFRFARYRADLAERPEAFIGGLPYEQLMLKDERLVRFSRKFRDLCGRYPTTHHGFLCFMVECARVLQAYEPGSSWFAKEIRRLEEVADELLANGRPKRLGRDSRAGEKAG